MLQYFQSKLNLFFAHENIKKRASKVAHNRPQTFFQVLARLLKQAQNRFFYIINMSQDSSVFLSVPIIKVAFFQKVRCVSQISKSPKKIIPKNYPGLEI